MTNTPTCICGAQPDVRTTFNSWVEIVCPYCSRFIAPRATFAIALSVWKVAQILDGEKDEKTSCMASSGVP
jgi:hypothetical protein